VVDGARVGREPTGRFATASEGIAQGMDEEAKEQERSDESRREAGEKSVRPDIQAGALHGAEGDEPQKHEHPSYRKTAQDEESE
jgi:hypothetical protein